MLFGPPVVVLTLFFAVLPTLADMNMGEPVPCKPTYRGDDCPLTWQMYLYLFVYYLIYGLPLIQISLLLTRWYEGIKNRRKSLKESIRRYHNIKQAVSLEKFVLYLRDFKQENQFSIVKEEMVRSRWNKRLLKKKRLKYDLVSLIPDVLRDFLSKQEIPIIGFTNLNSILVEDNIDFLYCTTEDWFEVIKEMMDASPLIFMNLFQNTPAGTDRFRTENSGDSFPQQPSFGSGLIREMKYIDENNLYDRLLVVHNLNEVSSSKRNLVLSFNNPFPDLKSLEYKIIRNARWSLFADPNLIDNKMVWGVKGFLNVEVDTFPQSLKDYIVDMVG